MNEQRQLTFELGMTDVPSDLMCDDNALSESVGMIYDNGEHKPIQYPKQKATVTATLYIGETFVSSKLLYVHKYNDDIRYLVNIVVSTGYEETYEEHSYIGVGKLVGTQIQVAERLRNVKDSDSSLSFFLYTENTKITSVGKTIIISNETGLHYFLWRSSDYTVFSSHRPYSYMGNKIDELKIEFTLTDRNGYAATEDVAIDGMVYESGGYYHITGGQQENWNNAVIGLYTKLRKELWREKRFQGSFCVRAALKLYDGTYYMVTNPVFMLNHFSAYCIGIVDGGQILELTEYGQKLSYKLLTDYTDWSDIVKDVTIFVTREANIFDLTSDAELDHMSGLDSGTRDCFYVSSGDLNWGDLISGDSRKYKVLKSIPDSDLSKLMEDGVYYRLCDIGTAVSSSWEDTSSKIESLTIENLTTQDQLTGGDFYSHTRYVPKLIYAYNGRLDMANVKRDFFDGFDYFMPYLSHIPHTTPVEKTYEYYVTIVTDSGTFVVKQTATTKDKQGLWFYYPDARAKHVVIKNVTDNTYPLDADLKEHPALNGSYYFYGVQLINGTTDHPAVVFPEATGVTVPTVSTNPNELISNTVISSDVNNPFVFQASGYKTIDVGSIIAITTNTTALSQGQHGQHPLLIFSTSGVWGLAVDETGEFGAPDPFSREVCNNLDSITQTDSAVFFSSAKGLMTIRGNQRGDAEVVCVSPQLNKLATFLKTALFAYDYQHSLLWIAGDSLTSGGYQECYIYNMKTGIFAEYHNNGPLYVGAVNDYPDTLLVDTSNRVFSLIDILPDIEEAKDNSISYAATLKTRPMKFGDGMMLKSVREMKILRDMNASATVAVKVEASNDLKNWNDLKSLRGVPYKYFRLTFTFNHMKATDRFAGLAAIVQYRRTNKLR